MASTYCYRLIRPLIHHRISYSTGHQYNNVLSSLSSSMKCSLMPKSHLNARMFSSTLLPNQNISFAIKPDPSNHVIPPAANLEEPDIIDLSGFLVSTDGKVIPEEMFLSNSSAELGDVAQSVASGLTASDLNLTWWCPTNGVFQLLEYLHTFCPWWASIAIFTLGVRLLVFPLVIKQQKMAAAQSYIMPEMARLQKKISEAKKAGNAADLNKYSMKLQEFMLNNNMFKAMFMPLIQAPIFMSTFLALREMANYPIQSMREGGLWWFTDLTVADPYYILPLTTATTLFIMFKFGIEFQKNPMNENAHKFMTYGFPLVSLGFTFSFPTAMLVYWCTSNFITLIQVFTLKREPVRKYFNIPKMATFEPGEFGPQKGTMESATEAFENIQLSQRIADRQRAQSRKFGESGVGPIQKDYLKRIKE